MIRNIPDGWRVEKLDNITETVRNGVNLNQLDEGNIPISRIETISKGIVDFKRVKYINDITDEQFKKYLIHYNDILFSHINSPTHVGKTAIYKANKEIIHGANLLLIRIKNENADYVNYYIKKLKEKHYFYTRCNKAVNQASFKQSEILKILIPLPPLPQQEKIVKVLDISLALIEKQKLLLQNYDLFLKSKFIEMFGDPIKNPMGWEVEKLGNITKVQTGKTPSRKNSDYWDNGTVNWSKTTEVNQVILNDVEEQITDLAVKECNMILFPKNTILIAMYGQGKTRGKVVLLGVPTTINQAFGAILESESFDTLYLLKHLDYLYETIRDLGRGGNQENLNLDIVRGIKVILPPIDLQNKFASIVEKMETIKTKETQKLEHLEILHKSLMDKAFKGEIG